MSIFLPLNRIPWLRQRRALQAFIHWRAVRQPSLKLRPGELSLPMSDSLARTAPGTPALVGADAALRQVALNRDHAIGCAVESPSSAQLFGGQRGARPKDVRSRLVTRQPGASVVWPRCREFTHDPAVTPNGRPMEDPGCRQTTARSRSRASLSRTGTSLSFCPESNPA